MDGFELYQEYTSKRDYSGSDADEYAQLLSTIAGHIGPDIFPLLEQAEQDGKKLSLSDVEVDEITTSDITLL